MNTQNQELLMELLTRMTEQIHQQDKVISTLLELTARHTTEIKTLQYQIKTLGAEHE